MKLSRIHIFACRFYAPEFCKLLEEADAPRIDFSGCDANCGHPSKTFERLDCDLQKAPDRRSIVITGNCLSDSSKTKHPNLSFKRLDQCFEMIAGQDLVQSYLRKGYYLLTPGWLSHWQTQLTEMGFDQETARQFFKESVRGLLLLDTGVDDQAQKNLEEFAQFIDSLWESVPVGLSPLRQFLKLLEYDLDRETAIEEGNQQAAEAKRQAAEAKRQVADYAAGFDMLAELAKLLSEKKVVDQIIHVFQMLFAPKDFAYLRRTSSGDLEMVASSGDIDAGELTETCMALSQEWGQTESREGLLLRLGDRPEHHAFIYLDRLACPAYHEHYRSLALQLGKVCNLVLDNVRSHATIVSAEQRIAELKRVESLGVLAGGIAHDFNNLLTTIIGNAELALMDVPDDPEVVRSLEQIKGAANHAANLTNQMLAYSGKGHFILTPVDLAEVIQSARGSLGANVPANVTLQFDLVEHTRIEADRPQINQMLTNLVTNSAEAIGEARGTITISVGSMECPQECFAGSVTASELPEGTYAFVDVTDTGCGIQDDDLGKVFDPFFTTKFTGRGLGLAAVQGIAHGHNGSIIVSSTPERGTSFRVLFPLAEVTRQPENVPARPNEKKGQRSASILVIDDEPMVLRVTRKILERSGYEVLTSSSGIDAIELFKDHSSEIDSVVLDLTMPVMDGHETLRELRGIDPDVKAIIASGYGVETVAMLFKDEKPAGFIQKPFDKGELNAAVTKALKQ